ncbi:MAG: mannose-1-phosphate guanylyltransferase, partial [Bacteroidetes bacterium]|nr:mannose-1-phosphate guanylyltransferase [Bacteroidota bacterium]
MQNKNHYIIIMAGGIGSRFWPMSRTKLPKQFHDILNRGKTLIQETFDRFASFIPAENIYVVTNERYFDLVKEQLPLLQDDQILLEPVGRNTAPCVAYAAYKIQTINPNAVFVVAPSDHLISKPEVFQEKIQLGLNACEENDIIMTLGITPTRPDTGYGYIQFLEDEKDNGYYQVKTFTEKPTLEVAESFVESGDYVWNAGIFL